MNKNQVKNKLKNNKDIFLMSSSKKVKSAKEKDLANVSRLTNVNMQTLYNWEKNKPELFKIVILGCSHYSEENNNKKSIFSHPSWELIIDENTPTLHCLKSEH